MQEYASANVELRAVAEVRRIEQQRTIHVIGGKIDFGDTCKSPRTSS